MYENAFGASMCTHNTREEFFGHLPQLHVLHIKNNQLTNLPESFRHLYKLRKSNIKLITNMIKENKKIKIKEIIYCRKIKEIIYCRKIQKKFFYNKIFDHYFI